MLPTLVVTALALAGCGDTPAGGPGGVATTLPDTSTATPTASATTTGPPTTTSPGTTTSSVPSPTTTGSTTSSKPGAATPGEAIGIWMDAEGHTYAGDCAATTIEDDIGKYCSSLCKASADDSIYKVGPTFSEYTTWLLLEKSGDSWSVVDTAPDTGTAPAPW